MATLAVDYMKAFGMLSSMYLCAPSKETVENWRGLLSDEGLDLLAPLREALEAVNTNDRSEIEDLVWEYTRLFIGPYKLPCPPWESVYTSPQRLMMQDACDAVSLFYDEVGLALNEPGVMPDHIGVELLFLEMLLEKAADDPEDIAGYSELAERFRKEHPGRWVSQFAGDMEQAADSAFYKDLAKVTKETLMFIHFF